MLRDRLPTTPVCAALNAATPRRWATLVCVTIAAACSGVDERPFEELVKEGDRYLDPETRQPYSGIAISTFDDLPTVIAQRMSDRDGSIEASFENQGLSSKEHYLDGVKHGPYEWYFESGQLFEAGTYRDGQLNGPYRAYWENGELYEEGTYREGRFEGPRRWYVGGRLVELATYSGGVMQGLYERYNEDGSLDLKGMLFSDEACGMWIEGDHSLSYPDCGSRTTE